MQSLYPFALNVMIHLLQNVISFWIGSIFRARHINPNPAIILYTCQTSDKILIDFSDAGLGTKWHVLCSVRCRLEVLIHTLLSVCSYSVWPNSKLPQISHNLIFAPPFAWSGIFLLMRSGKLLVDLALVSSLKLSIFTMENTFRCYTRGVAFS